MAQRSEGTCSGFCGEGSYRPINSICGCSAAEPGFCPQAFLLSVLSRVFSWVPVNSGGSCPLLLGPVTKLALSLAGIPTLIVLDPQGEVITRQGRVEVLNDEDCREFPWHPKPVLELSDSNAVQLNEGPCLVLFVGMKHSGGGGGVRVGGTGRNSWGHVCPYSFLLSWNNAEPGPLSLPAALLLTPMIYSWLSPCRRCSGSCCCASLPSCFQLPAGKNRSGQRCLGWGWGGGLMNRPFVGEEAGLHRSSCRGRAPSGSGSARAAPADHLCSDQLALGCWSWPSLR